MHTPTILIIAAAASAAVAAPVTTVKPTDSTNPTKPTNPTNYNAPIAKALVSAGMVDTEGHCMHPLHDGLAYPPRAALYAADAAAADFAAASVAAAQAEEEETQEQYNKKLVKMDKALWRIYTPPGELHEGRVIYMRDWENIEGYTAWR
ncbi:hypothetical protein J4E85_008327 [Alternaria conjuncta]|uniref:uncharacterized protein n=1 Tax=Alternaria conjuncta TaxID=181017 RepID=UPI0022206E5D|nr:uncharacterized protein J4E85_008327 [Alternaria conjuncta]KAI4923290.1 hypothetical protein J4E85_008327 [Alternaria conjuncta]